MPAARFYVFMLYSNRWEPVRKNPDIQEIWRTFPIRFIPTVHQSEVLFSLLSVSDLTCCLSCQITFSGFGSFIWNWSRSPSDAVKILCISKPCWVQVCVCTEKGFMVYGCVPGHATRNYSSICRTEGCRKFSLPPVLYSEALLFWKTL